MVFRQGIFRTNQLLNNYRKFSSMKFLETSVNDDTGIATVTMKRPPVNSLNLELLTEFSNVLTDLKKNKSQGMILTSFSNKVFTAGLDIMEMYKPDQERFKQFWSTLQEVWMQLYGSPFPTVAAINGHAPAGGCLLSVSCEYRVMVKNFTIGLNETQLGIAAPPWFIQAMLNTISKRNTEISLTSGKLYKTDEALSIGLIDEIANDKEEALKKSEAFFNRFEMIPPMARAYSKEMVRRKDVDDLKKNRDEDLQRTLELILQPQVQQSLEFYLAYLKNKKEAA
ncbi:hypothetical protein FQR65_LT00316 [Abscondita terminalis]|nr:hypothetical protein FQR65_LT00316 [Abscondita terminalis]